MRHTERDTSTRANLTGGLLHVVALTDIMFMCVSK